MIILFTTVAPHPLSDELAFSGHQVYEAVAVSEVLNLADWYPNATILITSDVDSDRAKIIQRHYPTLHLQPSATAKEILWEICQIDPVNVNSVQ